MRSPSTRIVTSCGGGWRPSMRRPQRTAVTLAGGSPAARTGVRAETGCQRTSRPDRMTAALARLDPMSPPDAAGERQYPTPAGRPQGVPARAVLVLLVA